MLARFALALLTCLLPTSLFAVDLASEAAPGTSFDVLDGFHVERIYSVPNESQGSWVAITVDDFGRLYTSDQYGKLYRVTPPAISGSETKIERIDLGHWPGAGAAVRLRFALCDGQRQRGRAVPCPGYRW